MIRELKYFLFAASILCFLFFTIKYYFSDKNIKRSFILIDKIDEKINNYENDLAILNSNTENIIEYVDEPNKKKKKYYFLDLLNLND